LVVSNTLQIYHRLPAPARSLAASLRGYYLRSWRYSRETDRLVAEALEREAWPAERWKIWQEERLAFVLDRAATRVPYYREQWAQRRAQGDRASWSYLENWPILEKSPLRTAPQAFVADDCNPRRMYHNHTSGTTGTSLDLWFSRNAVRSWYALFEARNRLWHDVSRHDRWAILGGQLVTPVSRRRPPFWVWNAGLNQLYLSSYHLAPDLIPHYLEALQRHRITYLWGYSSSLYALAQAVLRSGRRDIQMKVALSNAEPLFDYQRDAIAAAFQCPVRETYGMVENVAAASECGHGRLHLSPEVGLVEVLDADQPVLAGTTGDLICTGFINTDMPLIRYRVGDRGALAHPEATCGCGRSLPLVVSIEGRTDDVLYTLDGRIIGRLDPVFKTNLPVLEAQIIQEALNHVRIRFVPAPGYTEAVGQSMVDRLRDRMGPIEVTLEAISEVPRTSNGKFRAVVCNIPQSERPIPGKVLG
jgi:phenylacetate-CoA ligase